MIVRVRRQLETVFEWSSEFGIAPHEWTAQTRTLDAAGARAGDSVQVREGGHQDVKRVAFSPITRVAPELPGSTPLIYPSHAFLLPRGMQSLAVCSA